ncbi:MAG: putative glycosyl hydrolase [Mycobacterium sp.]|nr:putative glycosyl hydrolase [Mycobacterium sp.]
MPPQPDAAAPEPAAVGLPAGTTACLFDLDGVLTETATVHAAAWKEMFDAYLQERSSRTGEPFRPFSIADDYPAYVDGKQRADGTRSFLASRGIELPEGDPDDPPEAETVAGLGNRKNALVLEKIRTEGVHAYQGSLDYVRACRRAGLRTAVVSSSANTADVLHVVGIEDLFDARIDGVVARDRKLPGKPAPDTFVAGAEALSATPRQAVVYEDALAGVAAGRAGRFGYVVGVNRVDAQHGRDLAAHGADVVVSDLAELLPEAGA